MSVKGHMQKVKRNVWRHGILLAIGCKAGKMWEEFRYFCFLRCNGGVDPRLSLQTRFDELCEREKALEEERDALRLKVRALEDAQNKLDELRECVAWYIECAEKVVTMERWFIPEPYEGEARESYNAARKAVEDLL